MEKLKRAATLVIFLLAVFVITKWIGASAESSLVDEKEVEAAKERLGDSLENGEFLLNGIRYQIPFSYRTLEDNGWSFSDKNIYVYPTSVEANSLFVNPLILSKDNEQMKVMVRNLSASSVTLSNSEVFKVSFTKDSKGKLILPKGASYNTTIEEFEEMFGKADSKDETASSIIVKYKYSDLSYEIKFDGETKKMTSLEILLSTS